LINKGGPFQQILGRIAAQAQLGENREIRPALLRLLGKRQNSGSISTEIAYRGIELREGYFHAGTLEYGRTPEIANAGVNICAHFAYPKTPYVISTGGRRFLPSRSGEISLPLQSFRI
jgi:hypothetical protein